MSTPRAPRPRKSQVARAAQAGEASRKVWIIVAVVAVVAFAGVIAVALSQEESTKGTEVAEVSVTGQPLPVQDAQASVGVEAPELSGTSITGDPISIGNDGRPKLIAFFAHWCPHCQVEVPVVRDWLEDGQLPSDVDFFAVSSSIRPGQPNYPPSKWFTRENWEAPTMKDDASSSAHMAFGGGNFPYWVAVGADGTITSVQSGELTPAALDQLVAQVQSAE